MAIETIDQENLLRDFQNRYEKLVSENQSLSQKIKQNEVEALKLLGAIETLQYLTKEDTETVEEE